ncbi:MAG: choice-of-anchor B family protein, partial [Bacteroidota bacterium]
MIRQSIFFLFSLSLSVLSLAQPAGNLNTTLISVMDDYNIGDRSYNEVWGFTDKNGLEYAILGARERTIIYEIAEPADPIEVANIPGPNSIWRDMKSFGDFIYVVADRGTDGLLIIDMSEAPRNITYTNWKPFLTVGADTRTLEKCHNLYIDENGIAYLAGCNVNGGGVLMVDIASEPGVPQFIGPATFRYSHDVFVRGDTVYSSDLVDGFFSVTDVSNKQSPRLLATQPTTRTFTHNAWLSDDGNYLFTTDEKSDAFVDAYDISDLDNIKLVDTYRPIATENMGVIPHNVHYKDGFLVISYYSDGVRIVDASRPENLIEVGGYDTTPKTGNADGCWGAFPYLPSGLVLASDMNFGLFVLEVDYKRAAYLEGTVTDAFTGLALNDVEITIQSPAPNFELSAPDGSYKTGQSEAGIFRVTYSKEGYNPVVIETEFIGGEVLIQDVELNTLESREISGTIRDVDGQGIPGGHVTVYGRGLSYTAKSNADGSFILSGVPVNVYNITIGAWGYKEQFIKNLRLENNDIINVTLTEGYQDGFAADQGWTVASSASTGDWEREVPIGTVFEGETINPDADVPDDNGVFAFITGNEVGAFNAFDVDNGIVTLSSPIFDLSQYENPLLEYATW